MHVRRLPAHVEVLTPAKINLFLEVLGKRADGYHEIETLLAAVTLYDRLTFIPDGQNEIRLEVRWALGLAAKDARPSNGPVTARELLSAEIPHGPENLAWRAAALLQQRSGTRRGATIRLVKRIPAAAGLGGASSDAAATLVAANEAWELNWPQHRLISLAGELGSDVPFFLAGGAAVARGRGERVASVRAPRLHVMIVRPPVGLSTPQV
jgi:4-diphosphocytidyl-2-C-methyl-D-erythritol kinase